MEIKDHSPSRRSKWNEFALAAHIKGHVAFQGQLGRGMHNLEIDSPLTKGVKGRVKAAENSLNKGVSGVPKSCRPRQGKTLTFALSFGSQIGVNKQPPITALKLEANR